jgi:hypothetical protein
LVAAIGRAVLFVIFVAKIALRHIRSPPLPVRR